MRLLDYDPLTGIYEYGEYDHMTKKLNIKRVQDVEPTIEYTKLKSNDEDYSKKGIKKGMWHYATIPAIVIEQWLKIGVNIYNRDHKKKIFQLLNSPEYRYLKTTTKFHAGRS